MTSRSMVSVAPCLSVVDADEAIVLRVRGTRDLVLVFGHSKQVAGRYARRTPHADSE